MSCSINNSNSDSSIFQGDKPLSKIIWNNGESSSESVIKKHNEEIRERERMYKSSPKYREDILKYIKEFKDMLEPDTIEREKNELRKNQISNIEDDLKYQSFIENEEIFQVFFSEMDDNEYFEHLKLHPSHQDVISSGKYESVEEYRESLYESLSLDHQILLDSHFKSVEECKQYLKRILSLEYKLEIYDRNIEFAKSQLEYHTKKLQELDTENTNTIYNSSPVSDKVYSIPIL